MNAKRKSLVFFSAVLMLFAVGCQGGDTTSSSITTPFLGGDGGVEIGILEGNPPAEVTDGNIFPFNAIVSLKNVGEQDIAKANAKVSLIGFLPSQFNPAIVPATVPPTFDFDETKLKDQNPLDDLTGRKKEADGNVLEPVEIFLTLPKDATGADKQFKFKDTIQGNTVFIFRADVCYLYKTKAISELCILQNQIDRSPNAICNPTEPKTIFNSGSQIKTSSFRESVAGKDKVQFSFDVMHSGTGSAFDPTTPADCPKDPTNRRTKEDQVVVTVDTGLPPRVAPAATNYKLSCVGLADVAGATTAKQSGKVKLIGDKRTITCTLDLDPARNDFKKPIDISVDFNYDQTADKEVLVKHLIS